MALVGPGSGVPLAGAPANLQPGTEVLVCYDVVPPEWHSRVLLWHVVGDRWVIRTPDGDIYVEEISIGNRNLCGWRVRPLDRSLPFGGTCARLSGSARRSRFAAATSRGASPCSF